MITPVTLPLYERTESFERRTTSSRVPAVGAGAGAGRPGAGTGGAAGAGAGTGAGAGAGAGAGGGAALPDPPALPAADPGGGVRTGGAMLWEHWL